MKALLLSLLLATTAHATPNPTTKAATMHVTQAKQNLAHARADLKAAKSHERAEKRAKAKALRMKRDHERALKALAKEDTATISEDSEPAGEPTFNQPTERDCQRMAVSGETWEDACERVLGIDPSRWDSSGRLTVTTDPQAY